MKKEEKDYMTLEDLKTMFLSIPVKERIKIDKLAKKMRKEQDEREKNEKN